MSITEADRRRLYRRLQEHLGTEEADILMEHLPPVGWADVSTTTDVNHAVALVNKDLEFATLRLSSEFSVLRQELEATEHRLRAEFHSTMRSMTIGIIGANVAVTSLGVALLAVIR